MTGNSPEAGFGDNLVGCEDLDADGRWVGMNLSWDWARDDLVILQHLETKRPAMSKPNNDR